MLILHNKPKILPFRDKDEWSPSLSLPRDQMGNESIRTRFRLRARCNDGGVVWCGLFEDRDDADAFLYAIVCGTLNIERELWKLPTPNWHPGISPDLYYEFSTIVLLTSPLSTNTSWTKPADWNNSSNTIETLGAGASGSSDNSPTRHACGGGGGAYNTISNLTLVGNPTYQLGAGGTSVTGNVAGNPGGDTWFNGATLAASSCGSKGGLGGERGSGSRLGGAGGAAASGIGSGFDGGRGGNLTGASGGGASGGGGSAGPSSAGGNGVDSSSTSFLATNGGSGGNPSGGSAGAGVSGAGNVTGGAGGNGTAWAPGSGQSGGGGGGGASSAAIGTGGAGGNYGGGGGAAAGDGVSGVGIQGIIAITYNVASDFFGFPDLSDATIFSRNIQIIGFSEKARVKQVWV